LFYSVEIELAGNVIALADTDASSWTRCPLGSGVTHASNRRRANRRRRVL